MVLHPRNPKYTRPEMRCGKNEARLLGEGYDNKWFPVAGDEELISQAVCTE